MHTIKPLDRETVLAAARETRLIITAEEHQVAGGLGSAVAEVVAQSESKTRLHIMGMQDKFGESGSSEQLLQKYGLDAAAITRTVTQLFSQ